MNPKIAQILQRREEIATHQKHLKDLEANLSEEDKKELAEATGDPSKVASRRVSGPDK
jgi:hypothetical protein